MKPNDQTRSPSSMEDLSIISLSDLKMYSVVFTENGKEVLGLLVEINGDLYMAPNSETWMKGLRPLTEKFEKNIRGRFDRARGFGEELPAEDSVDVIAEDMAKEY